MLSDAYTAERLTKYLLTRDQGKKRMALCFVIYSRSTKDTLLSCRLYSLSFSLSLSHPLSLDRYAFIFFSPAISIPRYRRYVGLFFIRATPYSSVSTCHSSIGSVPPRVYTGCTRGEFSLDGNRPLRATSVAGIIYFVSFAIAHPAAASRRRARSRATEIAFN